MQKYRSTVRGKSLSLEDLIQAEIQLIQYSQKQHFSEEIEALRKNAPVKKRSQLYKLDPVLQGGILRVGGRLNKAAMPEESKHPVILSKHSRISTLIHQRYGTVVETTCYLCLDKNSGSPKPTQLFGS